MPRATGASRVPRPCGDGPRGEVRPSGIPRSRAARHRTALGAPTGSDGGRCQAPGPSNMNA
eukprot:5696466-Pyramimonas_sp.AAC.1